MINFGSNSVHDLLGESALRRVFTLIILFGVVSLLADITYEGARGVIPKYFHVLGVLAQPVIVIGGIGDLIAHSMRVLTGIAIHILGAYWLFTFMGYTITIISIPLIGLFTDWRIVAALVIMDRLGKAIRAPARDALFSGISRSIGHGLGFGIAEVLDQVGAIVGPLYMMLALMYGFSYRTAFLYLFIPGIAALFVLYTVYALYPRKVYEAIRGCARTSHRSRLIEGLRKLGLGYWKFCLVAFFNTLGLLHIFLVLYRASEYAIIESWYIPFLYLVAMAVDAAIAIPMGLLFDKFGIKILAAIFPLAVAIPLALHLNIPLLHKFLLAAIIYGVIIGTHESVFRAAVATLTPSSVRGLAYGIFSALYGLAILCSSIVTSLLYPNFTLLTLYALLLQTTAISILLMPSKSL